MTLLGSLTSRRNSTGRLATALACWLACCYLPQDAAAQDSPRPQKVKLVLQVTIDGLRADLLTRYGERFGQGGFRHLIECGAVFTNAHYQHANTETIVGHTTLATGAYPAQHGMVGNVWYDRDSGELAYNIEDATAPLLTTVDTASDAAQVDPAQLLSRTSGRSPRAILAPTFSDSLAAYYGGRSKIYAVSGKDRGAVSMAGHVGKAFWYSTDTGDFITSQYYYDAYPAWVKRFNSARLADRLAGTTWKQLQDPQTYLLRAQDDRPYEVDLGGYGKVFPHPFGKKDDKLFYTRVLVSPAGDRLTLDFTKALVKAEGLGQDDIPDYLAVSFSGVDAVNHFFGPSSLENEDVVLQADRTLADLFEFIDNKVGLDQTLIVLAADHGMADMPEYMSQLGLRVGRIYSEEVVEFGNQAGKKQFGVDGLVKSFYRPSLYLDQTRIKASKLDPANVERAVADALQKMPGIARAIPRSKMNENANDRATQQVQRTYHPQRSGDIYLVQSPYWFLYEKGPIAAMHGSPWRYDTHVPILLAGPGIRAGRIHRAVHPSDVAPTLAAYLGITPPSAAQGTPLPEALPADPTRHQ